MPEPDDLAQLLELHSPVTQVVLDGVGVGSAAVLLKLAPHLPLDVSCGELRCVTFVPLGRTIGKLGWSFIL
jgi:hypothetical protein